MPKGRNLSGCFFGMSTCRTGLGVYAPSLSSRASSPSQATQCPRTSLHPPRRPRHCGGPASRLQRESPRATPCRSGHGNAGRVLPWLSHVIRSGVARPFQTLVGSRQWSRPFSFPHRSRTGAPSLHPRYPASPVIQAPPPPCPSRGSGWRVPRHRQGFPCCHHPPLPCVPPSIPRRGRPVRASLASRPVPACSVSRRIGPHVARFEACSTFTHVAAHMVAKAARCTGDASVEVVTSFNRSDCYRLERQLPGGVHTRWVTAPFHGAREMRVRPSGSTRPLARQGLR